MATYDITSHMIPSKYGDADQWLSASNLDATPNVEWIELRIYCKYTRHTERCSVFYQGPGGACRVEHGGPQVQGPHGGLSAQATIIASTPVAQARYIDVKVGDVLVIHGQRMVIVEDQPSSDYPRLVTEREAGVIDALAVLRRQMSDQMAWQNAATKMQHHATAADHHAAWVVLAGAAAELRGLRDAQRAHYQS